MISLILNFRIMKNTRSFTPIVRRICNILLLCTLIVQVISIVFLEFDFDEFEVEEIHEISGFVFLGLMLVHLVLYWKSLKNLFVNKKH
jgi:cytochrome b561